MKVLFARIKIRLHSGLSHQKLTILSLISLLGVLSCSKDEVKPSSPNTPGNQEVRYKYTIENISEEELFTFNNDASSPKENYPEMKISAGHKIVVEALNPNKITPMIRSEKKDLQTEFVYNYLTGVYQINGYMNLFEAAITGDASLVSIYFPNPASGKADSLVNVKLPQFLLYKTSINQNIEIIVSKEVVNGTISLATKIKGKVDISKSTNVSQGVISSSTDLGKKTTTVKIEDPTAVKPTTPNPTTPTKPGSSCGMYNGKPVYSGPKGGCYYINSNGNKTYVARNFCC